MRPTPDVRLSWWLQMLGLVAILAGTMVGLGIWMGRKMIRCLRRNLVGRVVVVGGLGVLMALGLAGCRQSPALNPVKTFPYEGTLAPPYMVAAPSRSVEDLAVGESACTIYWYLSLTREIWVKKTVRPYSAKDHLYAGPPCDEQYGALVTRFADGLHLAIGQNALPKEAEDIWPKEAYEKAVWVWTTKETGK